MGSVRRHGDLVRVTLAAVEAALLVSLVAQVATLLGDSDAPEADPVLRRLLPDGYRDDDAAAAEFRRLTDGDLRATKRAALQRIAAGVDSGDSHARRDEVRVELDDDAAVAWLHGLADVRLALGTRLDVGEDIDAERAALTPDSPRYAELGVYDWLSWLQDALVRAVSGS